MKLSKRIQNVSQSATLTASQKASDLKVQGIDVISLTVGESDFNTPEYISKAAIETIEQHKGDRYTPVNGIPELRQAIADSYKRDMNVEYGIDQVFIGTGAKNVLFTLFQVLVDPGDEVIIPVPYWVSFSEQVKMAEGNPVFVQGPYDNLYKITVDDLDKAYTEKTVALLLNSPSNPSGAVYSQEEINAIGEWAVKNDVVIVADEIYNRLVYNGQEAASFAMASEEVRNQVVIVNGVSKTYAMTGWRIGYALGNKEVISALTKYASQANGNPTGVSQHAVIAAYNNETNEVEEMRQSFEKRLNEAYDLIVSVPGFKLSNKPHGAFYLFPDVSEAAKMTGYDSVDDFNLALIEEAHVVTVVGSSFGIPECLRFSYAVDEETFAEGIRRIKAFIDEKRK
ncbi:pyridoxal phosphate-dependent aminotransferase [Carnobacteriaceae bacterium 52-44]